MSPLNLILLNFVKLRVKLVSFNLEIIPRSHQEYTPVE